MIPIKLALRNFMCYRDNVPPIDFECIHTACISGNNGNGKSALIDAITWALWGQTRAASDDDLVYSGQSEVEVEFEFAVGTQHYRILRKHSRPKTQKSSGQTILEFQMVTPEGNKVLSGDTTTQTQQKITQLLRMDYDTFINSAFLRQGRADEFTKKRPGERKEVLANILQLAVYDNLEDQAREKSKEQEALITQLESALNSLQEELAFKPAYQVEFDKACNDLVAIETQTKEQEARLSLLRKDRESLENKKAQLTELAVHIQDTERNHKLWFEQAQQCRVRVEQYEKLISQRTAVEENYNRLTETRKQVQELDQKLKQINVLIQAKYRVEMTVVKAGEDLNRAHAVAENHIRELETVSQKLPQYEEQMKQVVAQLHLLDEFEAKLQAQREGSKLSRARVHFLQAEKTRLQQEIEQVEEKLKIMAHDEGATCPLCESELEPDGKNRIEAKYAIEKNTKSEALKTNQAELVQKEAEVRTSELEILQHESKLKQSRETTQSKYGNLSKAIADAREAGEKIEAERVMLDELEQRLASRDFAVNEQAALSRIENEITAIGYDASQHEVLRSQLTGLEQFEAPYRKLEEADRLIIQEKETAVKACHTADELFFKLETDRQRRESLMADLRTSTQVTGDLLLAETEYQRLLAEQKRIQAVMGGARVKLERLADLEIRKKDKDSQLNQAARQEKVYKDLAQAFGKKGVQAMLIEMAIPEIEAEANKLLSRMTDNRMHVKMETQRETKKGDVMETLDINISDELGTRNYEMFSGGEAFRIDFAIRIALSKLLARRAGAPLPTLIVDEGFGTQDSTGIEKIKEAITSIQDDFEKILVITHINDFKDAFPMRIEVTKTPEGSTVYLN
jgi:exonuclease SbcC